MADDKFCRCRYLLCYHFSSFQFAIIFLSATSLRLFAVENFAVGSSEFVSTYGALGYIPREGGAFIRITCARSIVWNISRVRDISVSCNLPPRKNESRLITNGESRLVMLFPSFRNRGWKYLSKSSLITLWITYVIISWTMKVGMAKLITILIPKLLSVLHLLGFPNS